MTDQPTVRVLLIDDDEDDFVVARDLLQEIKGTDYKVSWVSTYEEACAAINTGRYDICVVDYRLGSRSGIDLLRNELDFGREIPAIILTGQGDREVDDAAMEAGASGYLVKGDYSGGELDRAIRYALRRHQSAAESPPEHRAAREPRVISFVGVKGGTGATTVVSNVAVALARDARTVNVLDLRPYFGMLARQLDIAPRADISELLEMHASEIDASMLTRVMSRHASGAHVLASPQRAGASREFDASYATAIIDAVAPSADFTLIDLPVTPNDVMRATLMRSDFIALVTQREPGCLAAARVLIEQFQTWGVDKPRGVIVVERGHLSSPAPLSEVVNTLGADVYGVVPASADEANAATLTGKPLVISAADLDVGRSLMGLAERLGASNLRPIPV